MKHHNVERRLHRYHRLCFPRAGAANEVEQAANDERRTDRAAATPTTPTTSEKNNVFMLPRYPGHRHAHEIHILVKLISSLTVSATLTARSVCQMRPHPVSHQRYACIPSISDIVCFLRPAVNVKSQTYSDVYY